MKKQTLNTLLLIGVAGAAAFYFFKMMKKRSKVEAGPTEKLTEEEFYGAETYEPPPGQLIPGPKSILEIIQTLKRTPEQKKAAQERKKLRKQKKQSGALVKPRAVGDISVLY